MYVVHLALETFDFFVKILSRVVEKCLHLLYDVYLMIHSEHLSYALVNCHTSLSSGQTASILFFDFQCHEISQRVVIM